MAVDIVRNPAWISSGAARLVSLVSAAALSLLLTLYPQAVLKDGVAPGHMALMICMWGIAAGFVHGVGFTPCNRVLRVLLGPFAAWIMMPVGLWLLMK